jgi:hypothetical protein
MHHWLLLLKRKPEQQPIPEQPVWRAGCRAPSARASQPRAQPHECQLGRLPRALRGARGGIGARIPSTRYAPTSTDAPRWQRTPSPVPRARRPQWQRCCAVQPANQLNSDPSVEIASLAPLPPSQSGQQPTMPSPPSHLHVLRRNGFMHASMEQRDLFSCLTSHTWVVPRLVHLKR